MKFFSVLLLGVSALLAYTLPDAERAYVSKDFKTAVKAYGEVCPSLQDRERRSCEYWYILALSQTGNSKEFIAASKKLDALIDETSAGDSVYADLLMTRAQFEIYLKKFPEARLSLRASKESARNSREVVLNQICEVLMKADASLASKNFCDSLKQNYYVFQDSALNDSVPSESSSSIALSSAIREEAPASSSSAVVRSSSSENEEWCIQIGAFSKKENAETLTNALAARKIESRIEERLSSERVLYLVQSGHYATALEAKQNAEKIFTPLNMEWSVVKKP